MYCAVDVGNDLPFRPRPYNEEGVQEVSSDNKKPVRVRGSRAKPGGTVKAVTCVWNINTGKLECYRCGETYNIQAMLPMSIEMTAAVLRIFDKDHKRCIISERGAELKAAAIALNEKLKEKELSVVSRNPIQPPVP